MGKDTDSKAVPHVEVDDPAAAFKRLQDATRKLLKAGKEPPPVPTDRAGKPLPN